MKFEVNEKVFAFTMLLYGQQLFLQKFNSEGKHNDSEFSIIQPIIKELYKGLTEEHRKKGYERALKFSGSTQPILKDFTDLWYIMYCISNYRVDLIRLHPDVEDNEELIILKFALNNVAKKSYRTFNEFRSRHV